MFVREITIAIRVFFKNTSYVVKRSKKRLLEKYGVFELSNTMFGGTKKTFGLLSVLDY